MTINWLNWSNTGVEWATFNFCERLKVKGNVISKLSLKISKRLQTDDLLNVWATKYLTSSQTRLGRFGNRLFGRTLSLQLLHGSQSWFWIDDVVSDTVYDVVTLHDSSGDVNEGGRDKVVHHLKQRLSRYFPWSMINETLWGPQDLNWIYLVRIL